MKTEVNSREVLDDLLAIVKSDVDRITSGKKLSEQDTLRASIVGGYVRAMTGVARVDKAQNRGDESIDELVEEVRKRPELMGLLVNRP